MSKRFKVPVYITLIVPVEISAVDEVSAQQCVESYLEECSDENIRLGALKAGKLDYAEVGEHDEIEEINPQGPQTPSPVAY